MILAGLPPHVHGPGSHQQVQHRLPHSLQVGKKISHQKTFSYTKYFRWLCTVKKNYREVIFHIMTMKFCNQITRSTYLPSNYHHYQEADAKNLCEGELPQLAARIQRVPADVRHPHLDHLVEPLRRGRGTYCPHHQHHCPPHHRQEGFRFLEFPGVGDGDRLPVP